MLIELVDSDGFYQKIDFQTGFRRIELKDGQFLINNQPILFKGVNRHEHDEFTGHVVSRESMIKDIEIMKKIILILSEHHIIQMTLIGMSCAISMAFMS